MGSLVPPATEIPAQTYWNAGFDLYWELNPMKIKGATGAAKLSIDQQISTAVVAKHQIGTIHEHARSRGWQNLRFEVTEEPTGTNCDDDGFLMRWGLDEDEEREEDTTTVAAVDAEEHDEPDNQADSEADDDDRPEPS